eukprot:Clim_evm44s227 gene=Clim_evmTU44s227
MPPKKGGGKSTKAQQKDAQKVVEDKTFGLKNKKGAKNQKYIAEVQKQQQAKLAQRQKNEGKRPEDQPVSKKKAKEEQLKQMAALFKPVDQKVPAGVDPKSVLCEAFKMGICMKGDKCKFSHDKNVGRKGAKRDLYTDERDEANKETSADWDEETLKSVIAKKHGAEKSLPKTDIICKYFLDAVEKGQYGWFWNCPNGKECHYRHALPPGYVLKKDKKRQEEEENKVTLEEHIENERQALVGRTDLTPCTEENFLKWKEQRKQKREDEMKAHNKKREADIRAGKGTATGRELFMYRADELMQTDDAEATDDQWWKREEEEEAAAATADVDEDLFAEELDEKAKVAG